MPVKPSSKEEEYMLQQELQRRRQAAQAAEARMQEEERTRLKDLHWMRCPKCGMELQEVTFRGVRIDQCAACQGVWLDAGELEQLAKAETSGDVMGAFKRVFKG